jgi:hypothetical protein
MIDRNVSKFIDFKIPEYFDHIWYFSSRIFDDFGGIIQVAPHFCMRLHTKDILQQTC